MLDSIQWAAMTTGIIAAILIAGRFGQRTSGIGFLIFAASSIAWVVVGLGKGEAPLAIQNSVLLLINIFGVWRYLIAREG